MDVTEHDLEAFRARELSPSALFGAVERDVRVVFHIPVGGGKSVAVDGFLRDPATFARFDLVIYSAPTWSILNERPIVSGREAALVPHAVLRPRPVGDCGAYDEPWRSFEARSCGALGRVELCRPCQHGVPVAKRCFWPKQYQRLRGVGLIFTPEQNFISNRSLLPLLLARTGASRVLAILDEARLLDTNFEIVVSVEELQRLRELLRRLDARRAARSGVPRRWIGSIDALLQSTSDDLVDLRVDLPGTLHRDAFWIQKAGNDEFGNAFRYVGYDLGQFQWSRGPERRRGRDGAICFVARPYLQCHTLILSAHVKADYAAHRLGVTQIASPHENTRIHHSGTRIVNLMSRIGAARNFEANARQILDAIAVLILKNIAANRSTILVSRLKTKELCAEYLRKRFERWRIPVSFVTGAFESLPKSPDPRVIPILHYGIVGVNDFAEYGAAYCVNSYYIPTRELNRVLRESEPAALRLELGIESGPDRTRRVTIKRWRESMADAEYVGNLYLRKLEVDPAIQAVGRVRFFTKPRDVLFFAMHDLTTDVGKHEVVKSLAEVHEKFGIPRASDVDRDFQGHDAAELMAGGISADDAAQRLGIGRSALFERKVRIQSPESPYRNTLRVFRTLRAPLASAGAPS